MTSFASSAAASFRDTLREIEHTLGSLPSDRPPEEDPGASAAEAGEVREPAVAYATAPEAGPGAGSLGSPELFGERAALLAMAETAWRRHLGVLLDTRQVQSLLGVGTRQAVTDRARRGGLLVLSTAGDRRLYPAFQFGPDGQPFPALPRVLEELSRADASPFTLASWFRTPQPLLGSSTPAEWMARGGDEDLLVQAAARAAERLAH